MRTLKLVKFVNLGNQLKYTVLTESNMIVMFPKSNISDLEHSRHSMHRKIEIFDVLFSQQVNKMCTATEFLDIARQQAPELFL